MDVRVMLFDERHGYYAGSRSGSTVGWTWYRENATLFRDQAAAELVRDQLNRERFAPAHSCNDSQE